MIRMDFDPTGTAARDPSNRSVPRWILTVGRHIVPSRSPLAPLPRQSSTRSRAEYGAIFRVSDKREIRERNSEPDDLEVTRRYVLTSRQSVKCPTTMSIRNRKLFDDFLS